MIRTYCDFCGKEIETANDEANMRFDAYGCTGFPCLEYQFHVKCARDVKARLDDFVKTGMADCKQFDNRMDGGEQDA